MIRLSKIMVLASAITVLVSASPLRARSETEDPAVTARRLFQRLTGVPLQSTDPRLEQMAALIRDGKASEAAAVATADPYFYQVTVKNLAAELLSRSATPYVALDDAQATFIGTVADELDARGLLTGNYLYRAGLGTDPSRRNNTHYEQIDASHLDYKSMLIKQEPQWTGLEAMRNHAGVMTTRGWGWNYDAGTNRRAVVNSFDRFLCRPFSAWKVPYLDESNIARDVTRSPGDNPRVFQEQCRTCHGSQDPMRDAFAYMDFLSGALVELPDGRPAPKYSRGAGTWSYGAHVTYDDHWVNPIAPYKPELGFRPEQTSGKGIEAFGEMLANSQAFGSCMTEKVFNSVCERAPTRRDHALLASLASGFEKNGYNLKKLFQETAATPACLEESGVKTFNGFYNSLASALSVKPTQEIDDYYKSVMTGLPPHGRADEVSTTMLMKVEGLAGVFCKEFSKNNPKLTQATTQAVVSELSQRIYGRDLTSAESDRMTTYLKSSRRDPVLTACTAMASSPDFWVQ